MYKPSRPERIDNFLRGYTRRKTPHFFKYAKNKNESQVESLNNSTVNKLEKFIKRKRLNFKNAETFSYRKLLSTPDNMNVIVDESLIREYEKLSMTYHYKLNNTDKDLSNYKYICLDSKAQLSKFGYSNIEVSDMLVKFLYENGSEAKSLLWTCYGDILLENLKRHINPREKYCIKCGRRFIPRSNGHRYCDVCASEKLTKSATRIIVCQDCGKEFTVSSSVRNKKRCDECQEIATRELKKLQKRRERSNK